MAKGNGGTMWLRRSYNFIDKDPEIDKFRTIYQKEHIKENDLAVLAGLSASTVKNMFGGETKGPNTRRSQKWPARWAMNTACNATTRPTTKQSFRRRARNGRRIRNICGRSARKRLASNTAQGDQRDVE